MIIVAHQKQDVKKTGAKVMTRKELSQYYWLKKEIADAENRLITMREKISSPHAQHLTGMPGGGSAGDRMGETVSEIVDLEAEIREKKIQCMEECRRIEDYIGQIPDSMTRLIFRYRCIDGMTWGEVAATMGHRMSEVNAKQIFHRYLKSEGRENAGN